VSVYERLEALNIALPKLTPPLRPAPMFPAIHVGSPKKNLHAILFELFAQDSLGQNRGHAYGTPQRVEQF
jgi:hypothetical protein